jgi:hypothetical protein
MPVDRPTRRQSDPHVVGDLIIPPCEHCERKQSVRVTLRTPCVVYLRCEMCSHNFQIPMPLPPSTK